MATAIEGSVDCCESLSEVGDGGSDDVVSLADVEVRGVDTLVEEVFYDVSSSSSSTRDTSNVAY
jgi:hypothetical protein